MNDQEAAWQARIVDAKAARRAHIDELQATHNLCAWCGEARVSPGQSFCLTHEQVGRMVLAGLQDPETVEVDRQR